MTTSSDIAAKSSLLKRREFMGEYRFADSTERRGRAGEQPWPPHLVIGKRVFYLRESVERWLTEQEQTGQGGAADDQS